MLDNQPVIIGYFSESYTFSKISYTSCFVWTNIFPIKLNLSPSFAKILKNYGLLTKQIWRIAWLWFHMFVWSFVSYEGIKKYSATAEAGIRIFHVGVFWLRSVSEKLKESACRNMTKFILFWNHINNLIKFDHTFTLNMHHCICKRWCIDV